MFGGHVFGGPYFGQGPLVLEAEVLPQITRAVDVQLEVASAAVELAMTEASIALSVSVGSSDGVEVSVSPASSATELTCRAVSHVYDVEVK